MQLAISNSTNNNSTVPDGITSNTSQTCTTLPSTVTQYPIFRNTAQLSPFQNQANTTLAKTTNPYYVYHSLPIHQKKHYYRT